MSSKEPLIVPEAVVDPMDHVAPPPRLLELSPRLNFASRRAASLLYIK